MKKWKDMEIKESFYVKSKSTIFGAEKAMLRVDLVWDNGKDFGGDYVCEKGFWWVNGTDKYDFEAYLIENSTKEEIFEAMENYFGWENIEIITKEEFDNVKARSIHRGGVLKYYD